MAQAPLDGVERTALGVARLRARESERTDRLFDDPYAQAFVDAAPAALTREPKAPQGATGPGSASALSAGFYAHVVIRTRFFDGYLTAATSAACSQVVLLAAGLDTRAFRLAWPPGTRVFEVDLPGVLEFKDAVLTARGAAPRCERTIVPADLRGDWPTALTGAGFDRDRPTAWLAEGLLIYLTADDAARLLHGVTKLSAPESQLSFEHSPVGTAALMNRIQLMPSLHLYASFWKGGIGEHAPRWLADHGWQPSFHQLAALAADYDRPIPGQARSGFLTALRPQP